MVPNQSQADLIARILAEDPKSELLQASAFRAFRAAFSFEESGVAEEDERGEEEEEEEEEDIETASEPPSTPQSWHVKSNDLQVLFRVRVGVQLRVDTFARKRRSSGNLSKQPGCFATKQTAWLSQKRSKTRASSCAYQSWPLLKSFQLPHECLRSNATRCTKWLYRVDGHLRSSGEADHLRPVDAGHNL